MAGLSADAAMEIRDLYRADCGCGKRWAGAGGGRAAWRLTVIAPRRWSTQRGTAVDKQQLAILAVFGTAAWVSWLIFSTLRYYFEARVRAAAQDKLLLRVGSPEALTVFLASPPGVRFLRTLEPQPKEAWRAIIHTTQSATVLAVLGIALLLYRWGSPEAADLLPFGIGCLALAAAFGGSAIVSMLMHRRAGLLSDADH